jgi:GT2 family glycosyltransferase
MPTPKFKLSSSLQNSWLADVAPRTPALLFAHAYGQTQINCFFSFNSQLLVYHELFQKNGILDNHEHNARNGIVEEKQSGATNVSIHITTELGFFERK